MLVKLWLNPSFGQLPHISLCRLVLLFVLERKLLCILYSETILNELMETGVTPIPVSCFLSISLAFLLVITLTFQRAARHP